MTADPAEAPAQRREERGGDDQLFLLEQPLLHELLQLRRGQVGRSPLQRHRCMERPQQGQAAQIADEDLPIAPRESQRSLEDLHEVLDTRKILDDRVQDHEIERLSVQPREIVRLALQEGHLGERRIRPRERAPDMRQRRGRKIGPPVGGAVRSDAEQEQAGAAADLEHPPGPQAEDPLDGPIDPLAHLLRRNRLARVAAVPAADVEGRVRVRGRLIEHLIVMDQPPFVDQLGLHLGLAPAPADVIGSEIGHDIGDQAFLAGPVLAGDDRDLANRRMTAQSGLDLARLDAMTAHLELQVGASEEHDIAVGPIAGEIAGPIEARAALPAVGMRDEPLGGEIRPAEVSARQARPAQVQLTHGAGRQRLESIIEHVGLEIGDWTADRQFLPDFRVGVRVRLVQDRSDRRLRGAVRADPSDPAWNQPPPLRVALRRDRLAADDDEPQAARQPLRRGGQLRHPFVPVGCRQVQHREPFARDQLGEIGGNREKVGEKDHRGAADPGGEHLLDRHIEARRGELQRSIVRPQVVGPGHGDIVVDRGLVRNQHPFGPARRTRGVDHVGRVRRVNRDRGARGLFPGGIFGRVVEAEKERAVA